MFLTFVAEVPTPSRKLLCAYLFFLRQDGKERYKTKFGISSSSVRQTISSLRLNKLSIGFETFCLEPSLSRGRECSINQIKFFFSRESIPRKWFIVYNYFVRERACYSPEAKLLQRNTELTLENPSGKLPYSTEITLEPSLIDSSYASTIPSSIDIGTSKNLESRWAKRPTLSIM